MWCFESLSLHTFEHPCTEAARKNITSWSNLVKTSKVMQIASHFGEFQSIRAATIPSPIRRATKGQETSVVSPEQMA
jgi:hypothetical protein